PGSGNETARHTVAGGPITVMVCSFEEGDAAIVRLYGKASVTPVEKSPFGEKLIAASGQASETRTRQVIAIEVDSTMTSCGYGVPVMQFGRERQQADRGLRFKS
ncbi:MAG: pyridoxamine 5'-phosphate oxidase family protein, partial [Gammaproteobacteria bacterium]